MNPRPNPFVGPRSFEPGEKLYGRDRELRSLSDLLLAERIVLMHSPSGAGKTSLLKAGLLPMMRDDDFNVLPVVRVNSEPPEGAPAGANRYVLSTLISLDDDLPEDKRTPAATLAGMSLDGYLATRSGEKDTLIVLDQFEEVLTLSSTDRDAKLEFFNQLGEALRNKKRWALFSMREDYLGLLAPYVRPIPDRLAARFRLDLLATEAAIQAMQMPAKQAGVDFTLPAAQKLADDLRRVQIQQPDGSYQSELGDYVEPVQLQVVCYRLFETLKPDDPDITADELAEVGDVDTSLAEYYASTVTAVAQAASTTERAIREWFDRKLITPDGLRGQVRLGVDQSEGLVTTAVRRLENAHIIRADTRAGQTWVELAHDRLINPIRANNHQWFLENLSLFQRQAEIWKDKDRSEGLLLRGRDLETAEKEIAGMKLEPDEKDFLDACRLLRRRQNRERMLRRGIAIGLVASLLLGIIAAYFWISATRANASFIRAARTAEAASTLAIENAQAAATAKSNAEQQKYAAEASSLQAIANANAAATAEAQAVSNANAAATAEAQAEAEKANALAQKAIADEQRLQAEANALVAQSLVLQSKAKNDLANLLAVEAFAISDTPRTRTQLLGPVYNRGQLPLAQNNTSGLVPSLQYLPDGSGLVSANYYGCHSDDIYICDSGAVRFWSIDHATTGLKLPNAMRQNTAFASINPPGLVDASAISPDGKTLALAACDPLNTNTLKCEAENVTLWDVATRKSIPGGFTVWANLNNDKGVQVLFSPDGKTLALSLNAATVFSTAPANKPLVTLWSRDSLKQIAQVTPENGIYQMAFSPDGTSLAIAGGQTVTLLKVTDGTASDFTPARGIRKVLSLAYSPDGKLLAIGTEDGNIRLIDLQSGKPLDPLMPSISKPLVLAFSPDSNMLAAGYLDAGLVLWDVRSRQRLNSSPIYKHIEVPDNFPILSLAFSPDGKQLASASNEIILWDTDPASWAVKACNIAGRNFSQGEWLEYFTNLPYHVTCPQFPAGRSGT